MTTRNEIFDITIVGGGPTGLFGAFYAGLRGMYVKIIDSIEQLGGQLTALYPEKYIYDVAGFPKVTAKDLVAQLEEQAFQFPVTTCLGETVQKIGPRVDEVFTIETDKGSHSSRAVIITVGMGAFTPKKLDIEDIEAFEGRGIHYFVPQLSAFHDKRVLIVGGGDSAVDWALALHDKADITLIHRRDRFRAHEASVEQMMSSQAKVKTFYELQEVHGNEHIEEAVIYDNRTEETERIPVDEIILSLGFNPDVKLVRSWGLEMEKGGIVTNSMMETNIPGIYAA